MDRPGRVGRSSAGFAAVLDWLRNSAGFKRWTVVKKYDSTCESVLIDVVDDKLSVVHSFVEVRRSMVVLERRGLG